MTEIVIAAILILVTAALAEKATLKLKRVLWALFVILVFAQATVQILARRGQEKLVRSSEDAQRELKNKLDASLLNEQYTQGRLDTMNELLGEIATNSDPKQTGVLLQDVLSTKSTLKKDTLAVCADADRWQKAWIAKNPWPSPADPKKPTTQEVDVQNIYGQKFSSEMFARFGPRILAIVQRYGAIGVDVRMMEQSLSYGYISQDVIIKVRAFADRIRDDGSLKD